MFFTEDLSGKLSPLPTLPLSKGSLIEIVEEPDLRESITFHFWHLR